MFGYWREAPPHTPTPPVHIGDSLDPHHQLSNLTKSPNSNSSKFPPKSRSKFSSYEQGVAGPQTPRSPDPQVNHTMPRYYGAYTFLHEKYYRVDNYVDWENHGAEIFFDWENHGKFRIFPNELFYFTPTYR